MMEKLFAAGERIAREAQKRQAAATAARLRAMLGAAAVEATERQVIVRGKGLVSRWLTDPRLRFFGAKPQ